jgi:transcriptional regulator with XRE-family HTH domain
MISREEALTRNKIIGLLLRSARLRAGLSDSECAQVLSAEPEFIARAEEGEEGLTLPQLESLAHALQVPLDYFMKDGELPPEESAPAPLPYQDLMTIRRKIIGVILRQARVEAGRTLDQVASLLGYNPERLARIEFGEEGIPLVELDALAETLGTSMDRFTAEDIIALTPEERARRDLQRLSDLPPQVREFVLQPVNTPYLQVAMNLSQMPAETLRQIASGLLEITY